MDGRVDRRLFVGILILAALVVANAGISIRNTRQVRDESNWVAHTHEVIAALNNLLANLSYLEATQLNFVLSGEERALEPFQSAESTTQKAMARLRELTVDNPAQQERISRLDAAIGLALSQLRLALPIRRTQGLEPARQFVWNDSSRRRLTEALQIITELKAEEERLLAERNFDTDLAFSSATFFGLASTALALVAVAAFVGLLQYSVATAANSQAAIHEQREWFRTTLGSIGDAVIATDISGNVAYLNGVAESLTGWSNTEAVGRPLTEVFQIVNQSTRAPVENPAVRALAEGLIVGLANHTVLISRTGQEVPIDDSAAPIRDETGKIRGAVLVFRDITARNLADADRVRLAAIVESSDDAIVSKTLDGIIRTWNNAAERLFGYTAAEAVGRPITIVIPAERINEEKSILERLVRGERIDHFETVRVAKDGRKLDISLSVSPLRNSEGKIIGASKIARDISIQKHAQAQLARAAEANAKFRTVFEQGSQFAGIASVDGTIIEVNRLCLEFCGYRREDVIGRPFWECGWWNRSTELQALVRAGCEQAASGNQFHTETHYHFADGSERYVDLTISPVMADDRVLFLAPTGADITDRKHAEEVLRDADRRKDEFIALLAHELRNPLAPLRNGLQVMRLAPGDSAAVAKSREMMDRQLSHMVRLIDDLLDASRISRNKMELRRHRVLLADVISHAVETARPSIEEAMHELIVALPAEPIRLDADLTRLAQVFGNLIGNSAKYTERGGKIFVQAQARGDHAVVTVRDTGIGIPAEALPHVFEMFSQVDRSIERSSGGLGIGLALVKGLVEMHGGSVEAASEGTGKGSTFTVRLPMLVDATEESRSPVQPSSRSLVVCRRMLVVDDNHDSAASMELMLRLLGFEVQTAHDGEEALILAESFRPEVVLMDVGMPRLDGYNATRRLREQPWGKDMIVIALTGWGQDVDRTNSKEAGCDGHLVKPVNLPDLERLLAELNDDARLPA